MMDIEKLIERMNNHLQSLAAYSDPELAHTLEDAATALSTLHGENKQLRAELEYEREHANAYYEECGQWEAENEKLRAELKQVKTERDAAVEDIAGILAKAELIRREIGYRLDYESDNKLADLCIDYCKNNVCVRCYEEREDGGCNNFLWRGQKED